MRIRAPKKDKQNLRNKLTIVVLGRSGSGKGTLARFLLRRLARYGVSYIETGEAFRQIARKYHNPTADMARRILQKGGLFPGWFPAYVWLRKFIEGGIARNHLIFDGAARRVWEGKFLADVIRSHGRPAPIFVYIDVSKKEAEKRLLRRGRSDDTKGAIRNRLAFFDRNVMPAIRYYQRTGQLIRINGEQPPGVVWQKLDIKLKKHLGEKWPSR